VTVEQLLSAARRAGVILTASGDRLVVDAPAGALTPVFTEALRRRKPELLVALRPVTEFLTLKGGLIVPAEALRLALDLEARGIALATDVDHQLVIDLDNPRLSDTERISIRRWRLHLGAIAEYRRPNRTDSRVPHRQTDGPEHRRECD
jgi:hypothetical protein